MADPQVSGAGIDGLVTAVDPAVDGEAIIGCGIPGGWTGKRGRLVFEPWACDLL